MSRHALVLGLLLQPAKAHAKSPVSTVSDVSVGHALLQMVIALLVVVGCIWGLSKVLARLRNGKVAGRSPGGRRLPGSGLAVLGRQSLGKDLSIATVRWGEREVLVGVAGSTITFLGEARPEGEDGPTDEEAPPRLSRSFPPVEQPEGRTSFLDSLREATLRR